MDTRKVDGDGPEVHAAIMYDFIGRLNQTLQGSTETPKNRDTAQSFQPTLQVGHSPDLSSSHQHQQALALDFAPLLS